jgi:BA14K-like protein
MKRAIIIVALCLSASPATADPFWGSLAGGAIGGFGGSIIGGMMSRPQPQYNNYPPPQNAYPPQAQYAPEDPVAYCASRFRSYDPATGFYRGYDGFLRRCP